MKLQTSIQPRRDGTVVYTAKDGKTRHVFAPDQRGDLVCEIKNVDDVAFLLDGGMFFPADPGEFDEALRLTGKTLGEDDAGDGDGDGEGEGEGEGEGALPVEANTPPAPKAPKAPKAPNGGKKAK
jgi:hypothetical protein